MQLIPCCTTGFQFNLSYVNYNATSNTSSPRASMQAFLWILTVKLCCICSLYTHPSVGYLLVRDAVWTDLTEINWCFLQFRKNMEQIFPIKVENSFYLCLPIYETPGSLQKGACSLTGITPALTHTVLTATLFRTAANFLYESWSISEVPQFACSYSSSEAVS